MKYKPTRDQQKGLNKLFAGKKTRSTKSADKPSGEQSALSKIEDVQSDLELEKMLNGDDFFYDR